MSIVFEHSVGFDLKCSYKRAALYVVNGTSCYSQGLVITSPYEFITTINGQTASSYHAQNVVALSLNYQTVSFMPKGFEKFFSQIELIEIMGSKLQQIEKEDLSPFPLLKELRLESNEYLEYLPADLFEANPEIVTLYFRSNKLKYFGDNIFAPLSKLKNAIFKYNICINTNSYLRSAATQNIINCKTPQYIINSMHSHSLKLKTQKFLALGVQLELQAKEITSLKSKSDLQTQEITNLKSEVNLQTKEITNLNLK